MQNTKLRELTQSAILSSIAVVLYALNMVPLMQFFGVLLCPLPIAYIGYCFSFQSSILSVFASSAVVLLVFGPVDAYWYMSGLCLPAAVTGIVLKREMESEKKLVYGTLIILVISLFSYYGVERVFGLEDAVKEMKEFIIQGVEETAGFCDGVIADTAENMPVLAETAAMIKKYVMYHKKAGIRMLDFPLAFFAIGSFGIFFIIWTASSIIMRRFKVKFPPVPDLLALPPPRIISVGFLVSAVIMVISLYYNILKIYVFNIFICFYFMLFMFGLSLWGYFFHVMRVNFFVRLPLVGVLLAFHPLIALCAAFDSFFNFRKVYRLTAEEIEEIKRTGMYRGQKVYEPKSSGQTAMQENIPARSEDPEKPLKKKFKIKASKGKRQ